MSDLENAANAMAAEAGDEVIADAPQAPEVAESEQGSVTPEEVAQVLRGTGMKVDPTVEADAPDQAEEVVEEPAAPVDEPVIAPPEAPAEEPAPEEEPAKPADAPADAAPSFTLDVEDAEGVTHQITKIEDLPEDFEPKNNRQIIEILRDLTNIENERNAYEADQTIEAEADARNAQIATIQEGWTSEIKALQADKRIAINADGSTPDRVAEVYKYMGEENDKRIAAGKPTLSSFEDALDKLELNEIRTKAVTDAKAAKETARANGSLVGGNSAPAGSAARSYVAGSARNVNEAIRAAGLL